MITHFNNKSASVDWENVNNITDYGETAKFLTVTNVNYLKDTMKTLSKKKESYIFVGSKQKLEDFKNWKVITQQKFNDDNYLGLIKKVNNQLQKSQKRKINDLF